MVKTWDVLFTWFNVKTPKTTLRNSVALRERFDFGMTDTRIPILTDPIWKYLTCTGSQFPLKIILE